MAKIQAGYTPITVAYGDGIGPEIMDVTLKILKESGAKVRFDVVEVGAKLYEKGYSSGISEESWKTIRGNRVMLKAPITTPQGGGYKSLNVTLRKELELFANIRPCNSYYPFIATKHPKIDVVIVRENEEDLYIGNEYMINNNYASSIKVITRSGSEKIARCAFEYAVKNDRKKVTCMVKDNIMKFSDGLFHKVFLEIAKEYPQIVSDVYIVDIGSARLATKPENFDVVVTLNLYGDIISDIVAEMTGSVGLAGSSNIGKTYAMFEAIHGSAPTMVGQDRANPSALINAAVMMLAHIGQGNTASAIHNSLLYTIERGIHTTDIFNEQNSSKKVGTVEFGDEVIKNLGQKPEKFKAVSYENFEFNYEIKKDLDANGVVVAKKWESHYPVVTQDVIGYDVTINSPANCLEIADLFNDFKNENIKLDSISSKGLKIYPGADPQSKVADVWCLRFMLNNHHLSKIIDYCNSKNIEIATINTLYNINNSRAYSTPQGQ
jgi:isocitrate dehydrogenase